MEINSKVVAQLRAETGVGMMDCKKALVGVRRGLRGGQEDPPKEGARRGRAKGRPRRLGRPRRRARHCRKRPFSSRSTAKPTSSREPTDFRGFAESLGDQIAAHDAFGETRAGDPAELTGLPATDRTTESVGDAVSQLIAKLGENIAIRRFARLVPRDGERFASYVHGNGRIGVLVGIPGGDPDLGKDLAMHVAASDPRFAVRSEVSAETLETEREIARAQATQAGKPANVIERIAEGKVEKFYQEAVLTEQAFVKDPDKTVGQVVVERGGKEALDLRFLRFKLGEASARSEASPDA